MRPCITAAVVLGLALASAAQAQTQRNPAGATTLGGTTRGPTGASAPPAPSQPHDAGTQVPVTPDRPPLGTTGASAVPTTNLDRTAPGHTVGVGPNTTNGNVESELRRPYNSLGTSAGGGVLPKGNAGLRPNGGTAGNDAKAAPLQENGVRKVQ